MENIGNVWQLIARVLNGEASLAEQEQLREILQEDETLQQQYDLLTRIWKERDVNGDYHDTETTRTAISRIINKAEGEDSRSAMPQRRIGLRSRQVWMSAASLIIVAGATWLLLNNRAHKPVTDSKEEAIEARKGSRTRSILPDGTTVWLNAGS